jgi:hypothetical protein
MYINTWRWSKYARNMWHMLLYTMKLYLTEVYYLLSIPLAKIWGGWCLDLILKLSGCAVCTTWNIITYCKCVTFWGSSLCFLVEPRKETFSILCHYALSTWIHSYEKVFFSFPRWEMPRVWVIGTCTTYLLWAVGEAKLHVKSVLNVVAV